MKSDAGLSNVSCVGGQGAGDSCSIGLFAVLKQVKLFIQKTTEKAEFYKISYSEMKFQI